jgi:hypothetical protein
MKLVCIPSARQHCHCALLAQHALQLKFIILCNQAQNTASAPWQRIHNLFVKDAAIRQTVKYGMHAATKLRTPEEPEALRHQHERTLALKKARARPRHVG